MARRDIQTRGKDAPHGDDEVAGLLGRRVDGQVTWVQTLFGDETSNVSRRYRIGNGEISEAAIARPPTDPWFRPVLASAVTGQTVIQLASGLTQVGEPCTVQNPCVADPGCSVQQPCELRTAENLTYSPVKQ